MGIAVHRGKKVAKSSFFYTAVHLRGFPPPTVSLVIGLGIENSREWGWLQGSVRMEMKGKMKHDPVDPLDLSSFGPLKAVATKQGDTNPFQVLRQPSRHTQTRIRTHVHTVLRSGRSQYGSGTVGMQVAAGIQGGKEGVDAHTPQCCNPEILMLCAMAHCRAPWQFTSSLRHTQAGDTRSTYIEFHFVIVMYVRTSLMPDQSLWSKRRC